MSDGAGGVVTATADFERWVGEHTRLVAADLAAKHREMAADRFSFFRGTFYRWAQRWPEVCPEVAQAPAVIAVGDLHVENFGSWRDQEGRLVWGVNDFDESAPMPYTIDLVRLATSVRLAATEGTLAIRPGDACSAIVEGYSHALERGGRTLVLAEHDRWLRMLATNRLRDPVRFWKRVQALPALKGRPPVGVRDALVRRLPAGADMLRLAHRRAGMGSLGRQRVVAIADVAGALVAREAKAVVPSAWDWAHPGAEPNATEPPTVSRRARHDRDPMLWVDPPWQVRRLAPDCSRIELATLPRKRDEARLLVAMGWETANVHIGSAGAVAGVGADLASRPKGWLVDASAAMVEAVESDWRVWRKASGPAHVTVEPGGNPRSVAAPSSPKAVRNRR